MRNRLLSVLFLSLALPAQADEGMWLYSQPPLRKLEQRYGFKPDQAWLEHLQKSSLRFNNGGSGAMVSADGLVLTNQHLASAFVPDPEAGFYAPRRGQERRCPGLELDELESIEDVTRTVGGAAAGPSRERVIADLEKGDAQVVSLGDSPRRYLLYRYHRYTDVRLVFAAEAQAAFYGGTLDNFEYPRTSFDVAFFRVYEGGRPAHPKHYLSWGRSHPGELVLVSGAPAASDRLATIAELEEKLPANIELYQGRAQVLLDYARLGKVQAREVRQDLFVLQNTLKALRCRLKELTSRAPSAPRRPVATEPLARYRQLSKGLAFNTVLFNRARRLVHNHGSGPLRRSDLDLELESWKLSQSLAAMRRLLGGRDPLVAAILAGESPGKRARELIRSDEQMIALVRRVEPAARLAQQQMEAHQVDRRAALSLGYPEPNFTLRLSFGQRLGYQGLDDHTTFADLFRSADRHHGQSPYQLAPRWKAARPRLTPETPLDFATTADVAGGSSGSPVVNRQGKLVGLIFDVNRAACAWDFLYTEQNARSLAVDFSCVLEALAQVYHCPELLRELSR